MPWRECTTMDLRREFVVRADEAAVNMRALCREYGISPTTGYQWRARYQQQGDAGLADQSRRPATAPTRTASSMEAAVLAVRAAHPAWGGRKIAAWLRAKGETAAPAPSTITDILRRHGLLAALPPPRGLQRWERETPNALWQMDFKGPVATDARVCHPLTLLDDHARFAVCLAACPNQQEATVRAALTRVFGEYGLPQAILCDNGSPWGSIASHGVTALGVWLMRVGVAVHHGRPRHPQTQGKEERFHRTLEAEVLRGQTWADLTACQVRFDQWRREYNAERPHEAVGMQPPVTRYQPSARPFPARLPPVEYAAGATVRRVRDGGRIEFRGRRWRVGKAFEGMPVEVRATDDEGVFTVWFVEQEVAQMHLRHPQGAG